MSGNPYAWNPSGPNFKVRGAAVEERVSRKKHVKAAEKDEKAKVRARDKTCRWPGCKPETRLEVAHLHDKGMGGDKGTRSTADQMVLLCYRCHQGRVSLHSGDKRIDMDTPQGADGPLSFWIKAIHNGHWFMWAREVSPGITERQARRSQRSEEA